MQYKYREVLKKLRSKHESGEKIRVGFSVVFESVFPLATVCEEMSRDEFFDPSIIVVPDISRGKEHEMKTFFQTKRALISKYGKNIRIVDTYDKHRNEYGDISGQCDLYCPANPYDSMTNDRYGIDYFWRRHIPVFFADYGIAISSSFDRFMTAPVHYGKFWKLFCETQYVHELVGSALPWIDTVFSGYPKMDALASVSVMERKRKKVILAPHHSIPASGSSVKFSNFLRFHELFLELPRLYPDLDFVFRPHPLLFSALCRDPAWGEARLEKYLNALRANPNVEVQKGGDYMATFMNSDALVHDCGSFTAEYLYTGKPCCRLLGSMEDFENDFNPFARECLKCHELAFSDGDVLRFMDATVIAGRDEKKEMRAKMMTRLKRNFPNVSTGIMKNIRTAIANA